eukprot:Skav232817  [mRNA]  locus=scaffold614:585671:586204:- [translate_table: standard]
MAVNGRAAQLLGAWGEPLVGEDAILADLAAMHGLADLRGRAEDDPDDAKGDRLLMVGIAKVVLENVPQLLLQTSFFSLVFDHLTPLGRAKMLFSILLGLASASQKILETMRAVVKDFCQYNGGQYDVCVPGCVGLFLVSAPLMLALLFVLWTIAKLYFVFHCETHLWNFGSGCVEWT